MWPLRGWGKILGGVVSPRLRRGLQDRARYAGSPVPDRLMKARDQETLSRGRGLLTFGSEC